jgi:hypothetical protein
MFNYFIFQPGVKEASASEGRPAACTARLARRYYTARMLIVRRRSPVTVFRAQ